MNIKNNFDLSTSRSLTSIFNSNSNSGMSLPEVIFALGLLGFVTLAWMQLFRFNSESTKLTAKLGQLEDLRIMVRKTFDCQRSIVLDPTQKQICSTPEGGIIDAFTENGALIGGSDQNSIKTGKYKLQFSCRRNSSFVEVMVHYQEPEKSEFKPLTQVPIACRRGCTLDKTISDAGFQAMLGTTYDPDDMPTSWSSRTDPHFMVDLGKQCGIPASWSRDAVGYYQPTANKLCRCMGYRKAEMQNSAPGFGRGFGFKSPQDNFIYYFDYNLDSWMSIPASHYNLWISSLQCTDPICKK